MSENSGGVKKNSSRAERLKDRRGKEETVIKCSLNGSLIEKDLLPEIDKWVINSSKIMNKGSLVFNLLLSFCINNNYQLPDLKDQTLYSQCYNIGIGNTNKHIWQLHLFWNKYSTYFPKIDKISGDMQVYSYASKKYMVNFFNSIIYEFENRQKMMITLWLKENNFDINLWYDIGRTINGRNCKNKIYDLTIWKFIHWNQQILNIYGKNIEIKESWLKANPEKVVLYYYRILSYLETIGKGRKFTLAPISSISRHFITIDTMVLHRMMINIRKLNNDRDKKFNLKLFRDMKIDQWQSIFKYQNLSKHEFTYLVDTDGVSINFHFRRPKKMCQDSQIIHDENERVIAFDPGLSNILFGVEKLENESIKTYKLTKRQYYNETGMKISQEKGSVWQKEIEFEEEMYRLFSLKTTKEDNLIKFMNNYKYIYDKLWECKTQKKWAREKFRVYGLKKKCLDKFFSSLCKRDEKIPIIAYGAAKFKPSSKNQGTSPTTSILKKCNNYYHSEMIDEFNTSRICYDCDNLLNKVIKIVDGQIRDVRGLRLCCSTSCHSSFKNRDMNAALNILRCYKAGLDIRPHSLSRNSSYVGIKQECFRLHYD